MLARPHSALEHSRIVDEWLQRSDRDLLKIWMSRIQQPVILCRRKHRRNNQGYVLFALHKTVPKSRQRRWRWNLPPVLWKLPRRHVLSGQTLWEIGDRQYHVGWSIIGIQMNEVL